MVSHETTFCAAGKGAVSAANSCNHTCRRETQQSHWPLAATTTRMLLTDCIASHPTASLRLGQNMPSHIFAINNIARRPELATATCKPDHLSRRISSISLLSPDAHDRSRSCVC